MTNKNDSQKLTIVHSVSSWLPLTETWLYNQIRFLPQKVENHIVCEKTENLEYFYLPHIHAFQDASLWRYYWDKGLRRLRLRRHLGFLNANVKKYGSQILHSHFGNIGWLNIEAARQTGQKHVVTFYGLDVSMLPNQDKGWLHRYNELFASADLFLCEGPHMAKCLVDLGCPHEKVKVQHLGVEVDKIDFCPRQWKQDTPLKVLIAASYREKKGIPYALEALGRIRHEVSLEITIIGDATQEQRSQLEKERIYEAIKRNQLQPKIKMLGFQPHSVFFKEAYQHHVFLAPSITASDGDTEGGAPVSLIEIAASGMPIVSTTHCDIPEVMRFAGDLLLAEERDVSGLAQRLLWLINHTEQWQTILNEGRSHIEKEYNALPQAIKQAELYHELLS